MKISKLFASFLVFASLILPSIAYADQITPIELYDEHEVEIEEELEIEEEVEVDKEEKEEELEIEEGVKPPLEEEPSDDSSSELAPNISEEIDDSTVEESEEEESVDIDEETEDTIQTDERESVETQGEEQQKPLEPEQFFHKQAIEPYKLVESKTSRLGHINSTSIRIYADYTKQSQYKLASTTYTHEVYYIKLQAEHNGSLYYLISRSPSSVNGVVGWVKSTDMKTFEHVKVDSNPKTLQIKGTGSAYTKAWGGKKNYSYEKLTSLAGQKFSVNLTERVGNDIWHRGVINGKTAWIQESHLSFGIESKISRSGHINGTSVRIYGDYTKQSQYTQAGTTYTHEVYYIKKQAEYNGGLYYLISRSPSSVTGVVGWVKSTDIKTFEHVKVDSNPKTLQIKGTGSAYTKAWGGKKNYSYENLSDLKDQKFVVNLTERIGTMIWYRGVINGKTAWIQETHLSLGVESKTSRLGHLNSTSVHIYGDYTKQSQYTQAGTIYTHEVYYIKKQAEYNGSLYYLISRSPSSVNNVVGWVKSSDLSTHPHVGVDKLAKSYYVKGTGSAYTKAWGGKKNMVISNLSSLKGEVFKINLTEKVGNNIWYRGILDGKTVWIHSTYISTSPLKIVDKTYTNYNLTFSKMTDIQSVVAPQTDKKYPLWLREDSFDKGSITSTQGTLTKGSEWTLRREPSAKSSTGGKMTGGTRVTIYASAKGIDDGNYTWYHVSNTSGWVQPDRKDLGYYINPSNFTSFKDSLQFLKLSQSANINVSEVNTKVLNGKGILAGQAQAFINAGKTHGVNEIYLISHALLETGNGTSTLAKGVNYNGKTVYNMYGIGAKDSCPLECGSKYAYDAGWFTPEQAIIGGASFIGKGYVQAGQDTLYKMRWNPEYAAKNGFASHQYATDIGWALKQTSKMNELYGLLDSYKITLDIPSYN